MKKILPLVFIALFLASCATRINHPAAPQYQVERAQDFVLDEGKSRIHFFMGKYNGTEFQLNEAVEVYVNNNKINTLGNKDEFAVLDLSPGKYSFKCRAISSGSSIANFIPLEMDIKSGEFLFLAATFFDKTPSTAFLFGAAGALASNHIWTFVEDTNFKNNISNYKLISSDS